MAINAVEQATGEKEINPAAYCLGGTLLMTTLAYMAAKKDKRAVRRPSSRPCSTFRTR